MRRLDCAAGSARHELQERVGRGGKDTAAHQRLSGHDGERGRESVHEGKRAVGYRRKTGRR